MGHGGGCFGLKTENRAVGARVSRTTCAGARIWVVGGRLGWDNPEFGSWVRAIEWDTRGGCFGLKIENRDVGARVSRTTCARARIWVVGDRLGWSNPGFGSWVRAIEWDVRGGCFGLKIEN